MFESNMFAWVMLRQHSILGRERPGSAQPGDRTCGLRSSWYNLQFCQTVEHSMFFTVSVSPSFLVMPWAASTLDTWVCWQPCALGFCCQLMISVGSLWTWAWPGAWQWLVGSCPQMQMSPWLMSEGCEGWAVSALAFSDTHLFTAQHGKTPRQRSCPFWARGFPAVLCAHQACLSLFS